MSKQTKQNKYCNCQTSTNKEILKDNISSSFCDKCGCVLLKGSGGNIYYTLKTKQKRLPYDLSPISFIKHMKQKTEEDYPYIYEDFNINKSDKFAKEKAIKSINIYLKYRKLLLLKLQKLMKTFDYCDMIFYQCLYYLDLYLSHDMTDDISEKKVLYNLIGYFLISVKFKEIDIYEPSLDSFFDLSQGIYFSMDKIAYYEVLCLKKVNYNVFAYSAYDWVSQLNANGIVFNCELNNANEVILIKGHRHSLLNTINKYTIKLLLNLTSKSLFFKYCPMYIAMSLIQIAREKYIDKNLIKEKLFFKLINLYGVKFEDYKKCYEEILSEIEDDNHESDKNLLEQTQKNKIENEKEDQISGSKAVRGDSTHKSHIKNKNLYVSNKLKSSNTIVRINKPLINARNDDNSPKDNNDELITETKDNEDSKVELTLTEIDTKKKYKIKSLKNNINNINTIGRYSIDCNIVNNPKNDKNVKSVFRSNDNLPFIKDSLNDRYSMYTINEEGKSETPRHQNASYSKKKKPVLKELQHVRTSGKRYNSIKTQVNNSSFASTSDKEKEKEQEKEEPKKKSKFFAMSNKNIEITNFDERPRKKILTSTRLPLITNLEEKLDINEIGNLRKLNAHKTKKHYKLKTNNNLDLKTNLQEIETKKAESTKNALEVL
jgi:hypothetical protein